MDEAQGGDTLKRLAQVSDHLHLFEALYDSHGKAVTVASGGSGKKIIMDPYQFLSAALENQPALTFENHAIRYIEFLVDTYPTQAYDTFVALMRFKHAGVGEADDACCFVFQLASGGSLPQHNLFDPLALPDKTKILDPSVYVVQEESGFSTWLYNMSASYFAYQIAVGFVMFLAVQIARSHMYKQRAARKERELLRSDLKIKSLELKLERESQEKAKL